MNDRRIRRSMTPIGRERHRPQPDIGKSLRDFPPLLSEETGDDWAVIWDGGGRENQSVTLACRAWSTSDSTLVGVLLHPNPQPDA